MSRRPLRALVLALALSACGGGGAKTPSATVDPPTTAERTTTTRALTPEQEVEAAYLKSWDVYAKAALSLDTSGLESAYSGGALGVVMTDIAKFKRDNIPAQFRVDHHYKVDVRRSDLAAVRDDYVNHSVLLDPTTRQPTEPDPNKTISELYLLQRIEGVWKVITIQAAPQ